MMFLPTYLTLAVPQFDWRFIYECQDLNVAQRELVLRLRAPGGRMLFIGDPRQSIMAFAGADSSSYARILTATGAREFPLSVCYRCPTTHLDLARQEVPEIEARPGAPRGTIASVPEAALPELVGAGEPTPTGMSSPSPGLNKAHEQHVRTREPCCVRTCCSCARCGRVASIASTTPRRAYNTPGADEGSCSKVQAAPLCVEVAGWTTVISSQQAVSAPDHRRRCIWLRRRPVVSSVADPQAWS
jgi:hypothetical protein